MSGAGNKPQVERTRNGFRNSRCHEMRVWSLINYTIHELAWLWQSVCVLFARSIPKFLRRLKLRREVLEIRFFKIRSFPGEEFRFARKSHISLYLTFYFSFKKTKKPAQNNTLFVIQSSISVIFSRVLYHKKWQP